MSRRDTKATRAALNSIAERKPRKQRRKGLIPLAAFAPLRGGLSVSERPAPESI